MFNKIKKKIESKRNSKNLFWKFLVFLKDLVWFICNGIKFFVFKHYFHTKNYFKLKNLIQDKRILILGSGSSASELGNVPKDVLVFTCNAGVRLLNKKKINKIDLYLVHRDAIISDYPDLLDILLKMKISLFLIDDLKFIKNIKKLKRVYSELFFDNCRDNYYFRELIKPYKVNDLFFKNDDNWTSSGMRLLQYALYFKAKEIYLAGIDLGGTYFWGVKNEKFKHLNIDENFIKMMADKYNNIFSASKKSPITRYIPYKELK